MTAPYETLTSDWLGEPALLLRDGVAGSEAMVAPGCGANCVALTITHDGRRLAVLETPPTPEDLKTRRFRGGIPVLFPFPGRVRDARYTFEGKEYHMPRTDRGGVHHIHGVVNGTAWRVGAHGATDKGAFATCVIGTADLPEDMRAGYPFPFEATLTFTLSGARLSLVFALENQGSTAMPFDYGLHPYFRTPLANAAASVFPSSDERSATPVLIPAATRWPMTDGMPTGSPQPVAPDDDFRHWRPLGANHYDHTFGNIERDNGWTSAAYRDPATGLDVWVHADAHHREWVLYTQPNRPSVCIEPYTGMPNAINMDGEGIAGGDLIALPAGQRWQSEVVIEVVSR